jgi:hypothetical protein
MDRAVQEFNNWKKWEHTKKKIGIKIKQLCKRHYVSKNPLRRRLGLDSSARVTGKPRGFCQRQATDAEENDLVVWLKARKLTKMPPSFQCFQRAAKGYVANPGFKGGFKWWLNFCKRYKMDDIGLKKPEIETVSRAQAKTEPAVRQHFTALEDAFSWVRAKNGVDVLPPECIGNTDEKPIITRKKVLEQFLHDNF